MNEASLTTAIVALAAVLGLVVLAGRLLRRFGRGAPPAGSRRLSVVEVLPVGRRQLTLLRCDGRELLLLSGGPQDVLLPLAEEAR